MNLANFDDVTSNKVLCAPVRLLRIENIKLDDNNREVRAVCK